MSHTKICDAVARALMVLLALVMLTIFARVLTREIAVVRCGAQGDWVAWVLFDAPDLRALPEEELQPVLSDQSIPAVPVRDADGIIWSTRIDWAALYPPRETPSSSAEDGAAWRFARFVDRIDAALTPIEDAVAQWESAVAAYASDHVVFHSELVEAANAYDALLGWEIAGVESYNPVISAGDNYFLTCVARKDEQPRAEESIALKDYCASLGMAHLFVETPNKTCREDPQSGVTDFYNQNADRLLDALRQGGVDTLDLRDALHAAGLDHHASFYETDHHWKAETGLWAAGVLAQTLNDRYGFAIDLTLLDPERFEREVYEEWFLGSQGKKVTLSRARPEDIALIYPGYETDLSIAIPSLSVEKRGDFSVLYRYAPVKVCDYYGQNPYAAYLYGDNALTRITNHDRTDGKRVLLIGHSFDNSVIPFLSLTLSQVDSIDLREFTGDLETYLAQERYDIVIEFYTI